MTDMLQLKRETLVPCITKQLRGIVDRVESDNSQNLTNINRFLEDVFCHLLNILEAPANYINTNRLTGSQSPAVDVGDLGKSICYQVTSEHTSTKIKDTIAKFESNDNRVYEDFKELRFILISFKKPLKKTIDELETNGEYKFGWESIADINDFIDRITGLDATKLEEVSTFLDSEIVEIEQEFEFSQNELLVLEEVIDNALDSADLDADLLIDDQKLITINDKIILNFKTEHERQAVRDIRERTFAQIDLIDDILKEKLPDDVNAITQCAHDVYNSLKAKNQQPFEILQNMFKIFTPKNKDNPRYRLAVKAFVLYFFDDCTIFEKTRGELQTSLFARVQ